MNYNKLSLVTYDNDKNKDFKENIFNNLKSSFYMFSEIKRIKESTLKEYLKIFRESLTKNINYTLKAGRNIVSPKGSTLFGSSFKSMIKFIKLSIS